MTRIHTTLTGEDYLIEKAKKLGINMSDVFNRALSDRLETKKNAPEESLKVECCVCHEFVDKGFICKDTRRAWCEKCHTEVNPSKDAFCLPFYQKDINQNRIHEHNHFGEFINTEMGKSLSDIEKGNHAQIFSK